MQFLLKDKKGCRRFYDLMTQSQKIELSNKWMQEFGFIYEEDYKIFHKVIQNIKEITLKKFLFKVTNKILVTNSFLHKINKVDSIMCEYSHRQPETIHHLLVECEISKRFWNELKTWLSANSSVTLDLVAKMYYLHIKIKVLQLETIYVFLQNILSKQQIHTEKFTDRKLYKFVQERNSK